MKQSIIDNAIALYDSNTAINVSEICTIFKISRKTFYKYLNLKNKQKNIISLQSLQIEQKIEKEQTIEKTEENN
jgi:hypothetical protein